MEEVVASKDGKRLAELIKEKLKGDSSAALKLLQDSVAALTAEATTVLESSSPSTAIVATASSPAEELLKLSVSAATPRGRFDVTLTEEGLVFDGKTQKFQIRWREVIHLLKLPKPEGGTRKPGAPAKWYWVVLVLDSHVTVGKQKHQCLVLKANGVKAPEKMPTLLEASSERGNRCAKVLEAAVSGTTAEHLVLTDLFAQCLGQKAAEPQKETCLLESAQAWSEREEGLLYPLSVGLVFLPKPAIFVPAEEMLDVEAGTVRGPRGGDILLHMVNSPRQVKFENIAGSDVKPLLAYISDLVSQYQQRAPRDGTALDQEENDSDYEDEGDVSAPPAKRRATTRSQTRASTANGKTPGWHPEYDLVEDLPAKSPRKKDDSDCEDEDCEDGDSAIEDLE